MVKKVFLILSLLLFTCTNVLAATQTSKDTKDVKVAQNTSVTQQKKTRATMNHRVSVAKNAKVSQTPSVTQQKETKATASKDTKVAQTTSVKQQKETKATTDDRVSASTTAKIAQQPTKEMQEANKELATESKKIKKARSIIPVAAAVGAVGAVYVGSHNWHDLQDKVGVDRVAHFAVSYIINDQLQKNCGMNKFWGTVTTIAIGAAKEKWVDNKWDRGDFTADCLGALVVNITF